MEKTASGDAIAYLRRLPITIPPSTSYFLALFTLLRLADVATTRHILSNGGIELNPYVAPYAHSAIDLIASQAPYCLILATFAMLAASVSNTFIRGSAKWIYLSVLAMYCIPVIHNAAVIAGIPTPWTILFLG